MAKLRVGEETFEAPQGEDLLEVLQANGHPIATSCGGVASCGLCRLTVERGAELLSPLKSQEVHHLGTVAKVLGLRLACQTRVVGEGEIVVRVPEVDDVEARKRRKAERLREGRRRDGTPAPRSEPRPDAVPSSRGPGAKIEWRPRVLEGRDTPPDADSKPTDGGSRDPSAT